MEASVNKPPDYSQRISNEQTRFSAQKNGQIAATSHPTTPGNSDAWLTRADEVRSTSERAFASLSAAVSLRYNRPGCLTRILGCLKWAAVGFIVAFALMKLFEASHIHDDIPKPAFKIRQTKRATFVLSTFAAMLSALVWLLVQNWTSACLLVAAYSAVDGREGRIGERDQPM